MKNKFKTKYGLLKDPTISYYDKINSFRFEISLTISFFIGFLYFKGLLRSIRLGISDSITISSIILGILGVFIGVLIGQKENSKFFKIADETGKGIWFNSLMKKIEKQFLLNVIFIAYTFLYDFLPPISSNLLKAIPIIVWTVMFLLTLWGVFYIVDTVVNICIGNNRLNDEPLKKSD